MSSWLRYLHGRRPKRSQRQRRGRPSTAAQTDQRPSQSLRVTAAFRPSAGRWICVPKRWPVGRRSTRTELGVPAATSGPPLPVPDCLIDGRSVDVRSRRSPSTDRLGTAGFSQSSATAACFSPSSAFTKQRWLCLGYCWSILSCTCSLILTIVNTPTLSVIIRNRIRVSH